MYATDGYSQSVSLLSQVSLQTDDVFGNDGRVRQLGTMSGNIDAGLGVALSVALSA